MICVHCKCFRIFYKPSVSKIYTQLEEQKNKHICVHEERLGCFYSYRVDSVSYNMLSMFYLIYFLLTLKSRELVFLVIHYRPNPKLLLILNCIRKLLYVNTVELDCKVTYCDIHRLLFYPLLLTLQKSRVAVIIIFIARLYT